VFESKSELDEYLGQNRLAAVMFTKKDSQAHKVFNKLAKEAEGLYYVLCTDPQAMKEYGVVDSTLVLFKDYDDYRNDYTGALN
jgi:hypothetical protein